MDKKFWVSVMQAMIRTALVSATGTASVAITQHVVKVMLKETTKKQNIGFIALYENILKGEK